MTFTKSDRFWNIALSESNNGNIIFRVPAKSLIESVKQHIIFWEELYDDLKRELVKVEDDIERDYFLKVGPDDSTMNFNWGNVDPSVFQPPPFAPDISIGDHAREERLLNDLHLARHFLMRYKTFLSYLEDNIDKDLDINAKAISVAVSDIVTGHKLEPELKAAV